MSLTCGVDSGSVQFARTDLISPVPGSLQDLLV